MDCFKITHDTALIFDFDGTMCRLFKNYDLESVKHTLHESMQKYGVNFSVRLDAFDVFMEIIRQTDNETGVRELALLEADCILTATEEAAVLTGEHVKGVEIVFPQLVLAGYTVGISTNNSAACVETFLKRYCPGITVPIVGRVGAKPELMKPNTWSVEEILKLLNCHPENAIFIGDTQRDFDCAQRVGCQFIGMAATEIKRGRLLKILSSNHIVSDYFKLIDRLNISLI